jgi:hypothetical protein
MHEPGTMQRSQSELPVEDPRRVDRVRSHTARRVLDKLDRKTATRVFQTARQGSDAILRRLDQLDREWDIERWVVLTFGVLMPISEQYGRRGNRIAMALFRAQQAFLLNHALFGWCPPTPVLRRLGVRTQKEIDAERGVLTELLHLLGDDDSTPWEVDETEVTVVYEMGPAPGGAGAERR